MDVAKGYPIDRARSTDPTVEHAGQRPLSGRANAGHRASQSVCPGFQEFSRVPMPPHGSFERIALGFSKLRVPSVRRARHIGGRRRCVSKGPGNSVTRFLSSSGRFISVDVRRNKFLGLGSKATTVASVVSGTCITHARMLAPMSTWIAASASPSHSPGRRRHRSSSAGGWSGGDNLASSRGTQCHRKRTHPPFAGTST